MLSSKGASGVTGAGFIALAATLAVLPSVPIESLALLVGIDRFMSECRARTNLIGNSVATVAVSRGDIVDAIERLNPQRGTALGSGLVIALDAAVPTARINVEEFINPHPGKKDEPRKKLEDRTAAAGSNTTAAIVLLSDGQSNVGPDPIKAAELAASLGVRIYTGGMGTPEGTTVSADGWSMRVRLDEDKLKQVARTTEGEYFRADSAMDLKKIYSRLGTKLAFEKQQSTEITALFAGLGALFAGLGALLSLFWFNRVL